MNAVTEEVRQPTPKYVVQLMNAVMEEVRQPTARPSGHSAADSADRISKQPLTTTRQGLGTDCDECGHAFRKPM